MAFDPHRIDLDTASQRDIACYLQLGKNEYNGHLGARISAVFVMLVVSTLGTAFPYIAKRLPKLRVPGAVYLFARYFGSGVIVATAFIHLLDPAYQRIGPQSCVGMTGGWSSFSWPPAIMLVSALLIFVIDVAAQKFVADRYGLDGHTDVECLVTNTSSSSSNQTPSSSDSAKRISDAETIPTNNSEEIAFAQQFAAFLILEFGIIWHSVFIGLNFGVAGSEWSTLYVVLMFHQAFEGLGIGARMSAIPFPERYATWLPWVLVLAYGVTTPLSMAIGLGVRTSYNSGSYEAQLVAGIFDAISAGILIYNGLVELLARDLIFEPQTRSNKRMAFMIGCVFLGAGIMSLIGKWA